MVSDMLVEYFAKKIVNYREVAADKARRYPTRLMYDRWVANMEGRLAEFADRLIKDKMESA